MNRQITAVLRMVPLAVAMGTIFFLSHQPGDELSLPAFPGSDKVAHGLAYGTLGAAVYFAFADRRKIAYSWTIAAIAITITLGYGILDEFHQSFVPGRDVSGGDILADFLGGCVGIFLYRFGQMRKKGSKQKNCRCDKSGQVA